MARIVKFRSKVAPTRIAPEVSLAIERNVCADAELRNLIDTWIVPKMIDDWIARMETDANPSLNEDNGEQL